VIVPKPGASPLPAVHMAQRGLEHFCFCSFLVRQKSCLLVRGNLSTPCQLSYDNT
jgi:hypothetical protein